MSDFRKDSRLIIWGKDGRRLMDADIDLNGIISDDEALDVFGAFVNEVLRMHKMPFELRGADKDD